MLTTLAIIAIAAIAISTGVSAYGAKVSADAQSDASKYSAAVARNNAPAQGQQAQFEAQQIRDRNRRVLASQRAAFASSGVDPESGTALDVRGDSATQGELQALTAIYTGRVGSNAQLAQARLDSAQAGFAQTAGYISMAGSVVGGIGGAASIAANPNFNKSGKS